MGLCAIFGGLNNDAYALIELFKCVLNVVNVQLSKLSLAVVILGAVTINAHTDGVVGCVFKLDVVEQCIYGGTVVKKP